MRAYILYEQVFADGCCDGSKPRMLSTLICCHPRSFHNQVPVPHEVIVRRHVELTCRHKSCRILLLHNFFACYICFTLNDREHFAKGRAEWWLIVFATNKQQLFASSRFLSLR
jgi:hypothetical protein